MKPVCCIYPLGEQATRAEREHGAWGPLNYTEDGFGFTQRFKVCYGPQAGTEKARAEGEVGRSGGWYLVLCPRNCSVSERVSSGIGLGMAVISCKVSDGIRTVEVFAPEMLEIDLNRVRSPWHCPPISNVFSSLIGQVGLAWAGFENEFDLFLQGLSDATAYTESWSLLAYKTRSRIFRELSTLHFATNPTIIRYINRILGKAGQLQDVRNNLAHGRLNSELKVQGADLESHFITTTLLVYLRRSNETVRYTPKTLEDSFYDIVHLSGLMHRLSSLEKPPRPVSWQDKPALRDFLQNHHPRVKEPTLGLHPLASEG